MAIKRTVETDVYCDICGEWIASWKSNGTGVSRTWAAVFARERLHSWKKGYLQRMQDQEKNRDMQHTAQDRKHRNR